MTTYAFMDPLPFQSSLVHLAMTFAPSNLRFKFVLSDDQVIYAVKPTGELLWYQYKPDVNQWGANSGSQIGYEWDQFVHVFSGGDGIIYAIKPTGELLWYQDTLRNGTNGPQAERGWAANSGSQISYEWDQFVHVLSAGNGIMYGVRITEFGGNLFRYRDLLRNGTNGPDASQGWDASSKSIGSGWQIAPIEGYCWPLSAKPGASIDFFISSVLEQPYSVTYVRMKELPDGSYGIAVSDPFTISGGYQSSFDSSWQDGCDWDVSFSLTVPEDWPSGLYAAKCETVTHSTYYVVFVVKPKPNENKGLLVLANTNTWNAYNAWGGNSNYTIAKEKTLSYARPNLHLLNCPKDHSKGNHLLRSEIWLLDWLDANGYGYDMVTDVDFDIGIENIANYKAIILSTHPEYWSFAMQDRLRAYLDQGGNSYTSAAMACIESLISRCPTVCHSQLHLGMVQSGLGTMVGASAESLVLLILGMPKIHRIRYQSPHIGFFVSTIIKGTDGFVRVSIMETR